MDYPFILHLSSFILSFKVDPQFLPNLVRIVDKFQASQMTSVDWPYLDLGEISIDSVRVLSPSQI